MHRPADERGAGLLPAVLGGRFDGVEQFFHADGEIVIDLNGEYERFEAEVGVQPLPDSVGSVVFQVFADDKRLFDSGIMKSGAEAKQVSVSVAGARELQLVVTDAGNGIVGDCALVARDVAELLDRRVVADSRGETTENRPMADFRNQRGRRSM